MNKKILLLVALLVIGYIFISPLLFSANKTSNSTQVNSNAQIDTESETENATYGHVHALFE
ncbi:MAG: hypothetical protein HYV40_04215 [Candidatus Levybacteria bacterium]|nr:hypothetical protein [Candidatus Levybacteria bacterium]